MFHIIDDNKLYDFINELEIVVNLYKGKEKYDVCQFLDDVSLWMDYNREFIGEKFLPLSVLGVGLNPSQVSAFLYGLFVGKAMEKNKVKLKLQSNKVDKEKILDKMQGDSGAYKGIFDSFKSPNPKEQKDDNKKDTGK